jgi:membrane protease YdiL (CAAX protease family)
VAGVTPLALVGWLVATRPDLSDVVGAYVPDLPFPVLVLGAVLFALLNATGEELIWRGVFQDRLTSLVGLRAAIVLQAASFGVQHAHGVPRGVLGVALAGVWAVMLGALKARSRGLLAPILARS